MAKRPPAKKPKYLVLSNEKNEAIAKHKFETEADLQLFYDENNMSADDVIFVTEKEFNETEIASVDEKQIEIVLETAPVNRLTEKDIPAKKVIVENVKTGKRFTVNRKHYINNQHTLKLV